MFNATCGYPTHCGYWGNVDGKWMLFATEADYYDYVRSDENA